MTTSPKLRRYKWLLAPVLVGLLVALIFLYWRFVLNPAPLPSGTHI